jgi:3-hydroxyacyl-CoA dehydrogenase
MAVNDSDTPMAECQGGTAVRTVPAAPALADCDLVLEAIDGLEETRPHDVPGRVQLRTFGAAADARVIEVVRTCETAPDDLMAAMQFVRRLGRLPICVRRGSGSLFARLLLRYFDQALLFAADGVPPGRIDRALEAFGMRTGPFEAMDGIGLDVLLRGRGDEPDPGWNIVRSLVAEGRRGKETGAGWYNWDARGHRTGDTPPASFLPSPASDMPADEAIANRCVLALVNEGARALDDGTVQRTGDIDVAMVEGCGFPATKGGPLFWAIARGLPLTLVDITRLARTTGDVFWTPAPAIRNGALRN